MRAELVQKLTELSVAWGIKPDALEEEAINDLIDKYDKKKKALTGMFEGKNAMIVEDSLMMRMILEDHLNKLGVNIAARAENGFEAVKIFNGGEHFDFVFLNVVMPAMDGIEALEDFRPNHRSRIIMVTSSRHPSLLLASVKNGAHQILYRPFGSKELLEVMGSAHIFTKDMYEGLKERLAPFAENSQLTQENIRSLIKHN